MADRTPEIMTAHARQLVTPKILDAASLDPRLSNSHRPIHSANPDKFIQENPIPKVYVTVDSVEDGTISIDSTAEGGMGEANSVASAVADAYIRDQGPSRVMRWSAGMRSEVVPKPLSQPWELAAAVVLSLLASALILIVPNARPLTTLTPKRARPLINGDPETPHRGLGGSPLHSDRG
jgi:hypothetical protein